MYVSGRRRVGRAVSQMDRSSKAASPLGDSGTKKAAQLGDTD
jgi:hypothetical protein